MKVHLGLGYLVKLWQIAGWFTAVAATAWELHLYVLIAANCNDVGREKKKNWREKRVPCQRYLTPHNRHPWIVSLQKKINKMEFLTRASFSEETEPHSIIIRSSPHPTPRLLACRRDKRRAHKWGLRGVRVLSYCINFWSRTNRDNVHTYQDRYTGRKVSCVQTVGFGLTIIRAVSTIQNVKMMFCAKSPKNVRQVWSTR